MEANIGRNARNIKSWVQQPENHVWGHASMHQCLQKYTSHPKQLAESERTCSSASNQSSSPQNKIPLDDSKNSCHTNKSHIISRIIQMWQCRCCTPTLALHSLLKKALSGATKYRQNLSAQPAAAAHARMPYAYNGTPAAEPSNQLIFTLEDVM